MYKMSSYEELIKIVLDQQTMLIKQNEKREDELKKIIEQQSLELKEFRECKKVKKTIKKDDGDKKIKKIIKKKETENNEEKEIRSEYGIIMIFKNDNLKYFNEHDTYKIKIVVSPKMMEGHFNATNLDKPKIIKLVYTKIIDKKKLEEYIFNFFGDYLIKEGGDTIIIEEDELEKKISEIEEIINDEEKFKKIILKKVNIKKYDFDRITNNNYKKLSEEELIEFVNSTTNRSGKISLVQFIEYKYYGENCFHIELNTEKKEICKYYNNSSDFEYYEHSVKTSSKLFSSIILILNLKDLNGHYKESMGVKGKLYFINDKDKIFNIFNDINKLENLTLTEKYDKVIDNYIKEKNIILTKTLEEFLNDVKPKLLK